MKKALYILATFAALSLLALNACTNSSEKSINIDDEKAAIQIVINEHLDAIDSLDVDRLLGCMTDDHVDMPVNMPKIIGKQAYKTNFANWEGFFESLIQNDIHFETSEFIVDNNWAFQIGTFKTRFMLQDSSLIEDEGNYVWIFKKEADGNWKWARVISNSTKQPVSSH